MAANNQQAPELDQLRAAYNAAVSKNPSVRDSFTERAISEGRFGSVAPGEAGASSPTNYMLRPEYWDWRASEPTQKEITAALGMGNKPLNEWQKTNPFYVNPESYNTFNDYLEEVLTTSPVNTAASTDPTRYMSLIGGYYGPSTAIPDKMYTTEELMAMPEELRNNFIRGSNFVKDYSGLESVGMIPGDLYTRQAEKLGLPVNKNISSVIPTFNQIEEWKKTYQPSSAQSQGLGSLAQSLQNISPQTLALLAILMQLAPNMGGKS